MGEEGAEEEEEEETAEPRLEVGGEALPLELTIHVLSFLDARDRLSLALVSRPFRALADDDLQWRRLYAREWFKEGSEAPNGQPWERRSLPKVKGIASWKQLFHIRTQTERAHFAGDRPRHRHQHHLADAAATAAFRFGYDQPDQDQDEDEDDHDQDHDQDDDLLNPFDAEPPAPLPPLPPNPLALDDPILALLGAMARAAAGDQAAVGGDAILLGDDGDGSGGDDDADKGNQEEPPRDSWVSREKRDGRTYWNWGECLRQELPKVTTDEDDPVQLKEDRDTMEMRSLYLICREEYFSALSFGLTPQSQFEVYFALGDVTHEFSIYQHHFPHKPDHLREWYELACDAFERSFSTKVKLSLGDRSSTLLTLNYKRNGQGVIRGYANSGVGGEQTDQLFRLAYDKYQEALDLYSRRRPDYLLIENWAYAVREHANFNVRVGNLSEAKRRFDECFEKYEQCNSLYSDSIVLSNWADALREKAEIVDGDEREQLFKQAHHKYKLSFALDGMDCLTLCNWAMLYCLRARTRHARAQSLREDANRCRDSLLRIEQDGQATQKRAELEAELSAKEVQAAEAEVDYWRLVAKGKAKLEHGIAQEDLWTYFCMARLCSAAGEAEECREWMTKCAAKRYLSKAKDSQLADFAFVKDLPWFTDMQREASPPADPLEGADQ